MKQIISFFLKFKIAHLLFWGLKYWNLVHQILINQGTAAPLTHLDAAVLILSQIAAVYTVVYYFFRRFFVKKKYALFYLASLAGVLIFSFLAILIKDHYTRWFFDPGFHSNYTTAFLGHLMDTFIVVIIFFIIYLSLHYYRKNQNHKKQLHQQLEAELNFLKSQLNPHLVFNTLNSIYVLMDEDVKMARNTLLKFSSLLKYQLYDCGAKKTPLEKELAFISDFIELEKIRYGEKIQVVFERIKIPNDLKIAPLLLVPFVENAFKHIYIAPNSKSKIKIKAFCERHVFWFVVENNFDPSNKRSEASGGLGLKNVKRRLDLIYPKAYNLKTDKTENIYRISLSIQLI